MNKFKELLTAMLIFPVIVNAQENPGAVFLMIYPGARQVGMAGAFSAIADDALATYYNPAGLGFQKSVDFSFHHSNWLPGLHPGMSYQYTALSLPIYKGLTFAASMTYLSTGKTEVINEQGEYLGEYYPYDKVTAISLGIEPFSILGHEPILSLGVTFKDITSFLVPSWVWVLMPELGIDSGGTASSTAQDFGVLIHTPALSFGQFGLGLGWQNIGHRMVYFPGTDGDPLPLAFNTGVSYKITAKDWLKGKKFFDFGKGLEWATKWFLEESHISIAFDIHKVLIGSKRPWYSFGVEFAPLAPLAIRMGYFKDADGLRVGTTYSVGLDLKFLRLDFGSDADIYDFPTDNWRLAVALNIGTPILSKDGIFGSFFGRQKE